MASILDKLRAAAGRSGRVTQDTAARYQGYLDERSTHHVAGWVRNLDDAGDRPAFEIVSGGRVIGGGRADQPSDVLVQVGVGDGRYGFRVLFDEPLSIEARDTLIVRPVGSAFQLELAPALVTDPPGETGHETPGPFIGYIDERSTRHVAGWVRDEARPDATVTVEVVLPGAAGDRVLWRGPADAYSPLLVAIGVGEGRHAFTVLFDTELTEPQRDALFVRVADANHVIVHAPGIKSVFEPISHVAMDIVNNCNLRCPFCVFDYANTKKTMLMSDETFASALRLLPYVTDGNFWLSCLHEATLHPRLVEFIGQVPTELRRKLFYTTNLAKRMPRSYFEFLADSGLHHINVSVESLDPAIYERMRQGARHRIFAENWATMLECFAAGTAAPRIRYNLMAYRSNLREIPSLVETLRRDKMAWQVEIRHTYDEPHIPADFRESEFLTSAEWAWLAEALSAYSAEDVLLLLPPGGVGYDRAMTPPAPVEERTDCAPTSEPEAERAAPPALRYAGIPRPLNISMSWDGALRVYGEHPRGPGEPPTHVNYVQTNINWLKDPIRVLLAL